MRQPPRTQVTLSLNNLRDFSLLRSVMARLGDSHRLPFVEIFWDNYCHLDPSWLGDIMGEFAERVALHIMGSKFLEADDTRLEEILTRLAAHVHVLKPLYVSDHLGRFTQGGSYLIAPAELEYEDLEAVAHRVERYQDAIQMPLLLENYASIVSSGAAQADFLQCLREKTGCGLLFDISNAVVAQLNGVLPLEAWLSHLRGNELRCHVGGYRYHSLSDAYCDTHDSDLSDPTLDAVHRTLTTTHTLSICYEREHEKSEESLVRDMLALRAMVHQASENTQGAVRGAAP